MTAARNQRSAKARDRQKQVVTKTKQKIIGRTGLPAADNVRAVVDFVSPQKVHYTILKTSEMDAYDEPGSAPPKSNKKRSPR